MCLGVPQSGVAWQDEGNNPFDPGGAGWMLQVLGGGPIASRTAGASVGRRAISAEQIRVVSVIGDIVFETSS